MLILELVCGIWVYVVWYVDLTSLSLTHTLFLSLSGGGVPILALEHA